ERFLLYRMDRALEHSLLFGGSYLALAYILECIHQETAGATRRIQDKLTEPRSSHLRHELRDSTRRIVLACVPCALEVTQDLLVDVAELVPVTRAVEVDPVDLVDDLPEERAALHVVVRILKDAPNHRRGVVWSADD